MDMELGSVRSSEGVSHFAGSFVVSKMMMNVSCWKAEDHIRAKSTKVVAVELLETGA